MSDNGRQRPRFESSHSAPSVPRAIRLSVRMHPSTEKIDVRKK